jgi:hypothetical protein
MADGKRDMITLVCASHSLVSHSKVRTVREIRTRQVNHIWASLIRRNEHPIGIDDFRAVPRVGSNHASPGKHIKTPVASAERTFIGVVLVLRICGRRSHEGTFAHPRSVADTIK